MKTETNKKLRIIYAGAPEFAVPALEELIASEYEVLVYTQSNHLAERGCKIKIDSIKQVAGIAFPS